jgi:hypothetical protein
MWNSRHGTTHCVSTAYYKDGFSVCSSTHLPLLLKPCQSVLSLENRFVNIGLGRVVRTGVSRYLDDLEPFVLLPPEVRKLARVPVHLRAHLIIVSASRIICPYGDIKFRFKHKND